jgi:hypothetical protein
MFTEGFAHALDSPDNSAAFQLTIWEIFLESGSPTDLRGGSFHVLGDNGHSPTVNAANYLLTHVSPLSTQTRHRQSIAASQARPAVALTLTRLPRSSVDSHRSVAQLCSWACRHFRTGKIFDASFDL